MICLLGRFKGETNIQWHMLLLAAVTNSSLNPRFWVEKLVKNKEEKNQVSGQAISDSQGFILSHHLVDEEFHTQLELVQVQRPDLIPSSISVRKDYRIFCSNQKGWVARAKNVNILASDADSFNRWHSVERAKGL